MLRFTGLCCPRTVKRKTAMQALLKLVVSMFITIRGFSYASAWMEKYKAAKGLRKTLITQVPQLQSNSIILLWHNCTCVFSMNKLIPEHKYIYSIQRHTQCAVTSCTLVYVLVKTRSLCPTALRLIPWSLCSYPLLDPLQN